MHKYAGFENDDSDDDEDIHMFADPAEKAYILASLQSNSNTTKGPPKSLSYKNDLDADQGARFADLLAQEAAKRGKVEDKPFEDTDLVYPIEDLGADFYRSLWEMPSMQRATEYSKQQLFREGDRPYSDLSVIEDMALGAQVNLYFQLVISMSIGFIVMMVLAIPALLFSFLGEAVPLQQQDAVGLYRLTIGNIGFDKDSYSYQADAACSDEDSSRESICVDVFGQEMSLQVVALLVTIFEMLQVGVFMAVVYHIHRMYRQINKRYGMIKYPSITEYAVYVKNIPPSATVEDVVKHFSGLYFLNDLDWRKRQPVEEAMPVENTEYGGDSVYLGSWVAECVFPKKIRKAMKYLAKRKRLMRAIYDARARIKMNGERTPNKRGPNELRLKVAQNRLLSLGDKLDRLNKRMHLAQEADERKRKQLEADAAIANAEDPAAAAAAAVEAGQAAAAVAAVEGAESTEGGEAGAGHKGASTAAGQDNDDAGKGGLKGLGALLGLSGKNNRQRNYQVADSSTKADEADEKDTNKNNKKNKKNRQKRGVKGEGDGEQDGEGNNEDDDEDEDEFGLARKKKKKAKRPERVYRDRRPTQSAFVCFEYNESFARCLEDYRFFSALPMWLCFPQQLKLKGHRLQVSRAPEPDQLLWENLEVSTTRKACGRLYTLSVLVLVLLAVYALGSFAAHSRAAYEKDALVPANSGGAQLCARSLPFLYTGGEGLRKSDEVVEEYELTRAPNERRKELDAQCAEAVGDGAYFAYFTVDRLFAEPVAEFSVAACDSSYNGTLSAGLCPSYNQTVFCPCVLPSSSEECLSLGCFDDPFAGNDDKNSTALFATNSTSKGNGDDDFGNVGYGDSCVSFTAGNIGQCYCHSVIDNIIETNGVLGVLSHWASAAMGRSSSGGGDGEHPCSEAVQSYSSSTVMVFVLIMVTAALHSLLGWWVPHSVRKNEYHEYVDDVHMAVAVKVFISSYVNMSVLIVAAYGSSTESPVATEDNYVFSGAYPDFNRGWYGNVGFYLVCSFLLIVFAPIVSKYYHLACVNWRIWSISKEVDSHKLQRVSNQQQVNSFFVDGTFDAPVRTAQMLAWIFTAMTFATGLPLMMLLACIGVGFLARWDKYLVCRHTKKPTPASDKVARWALRMLPYAAALRLIVGCFMLSAADIFPHRLVPSSEAGGNSAMDTNSYRDYVSRLEGSNYFPAFLSFAEDRVFRYNTFPLFVFFALIVLGKIIIKVKRLLPLYSIGKQFFRFCRCSCVCRRFRASKNIEAIHPYDLTFGHPDPLRCQEAPLSRGYMKYLRHPNDPETNNLRTLCCCLRCIVGERLCFAEPDAFDVGKKWEIMELPDDHHAKSRTWDAMTQLGDGSVKMGGDLKATYDIIRERSTAFYNLEKVENYKSVGMIFRKEAFPPTNEQYVKWKDEIEAKKRAEQERQALLRKKIAAQDAREKEQQRQEQLDAKNKEAAARRRRGKVAPGGGGDDDDDDDDDEFAMMESAAKLSAKKKKSPNQSGGDGDEGSGSSSGDGSGSSGSGDSSDSTSSDDEDSSDSSDDESESDDSDEDDSDEDSGSSSDSSESDGAPESKA